jgi:hypothetical protein
VLWARVSKFVGLIKNYGEIVEPEKRLSYS